MPLSLLLNGGGAIIYRASRRRAEETAEHLNVNGVAAGHFHSRMSPERKLETQRQFLDGSIRVICATNAFGMGIDKPDIRLVIHADIPGSLENYLQEAGRAGRDAGSAHCVLLYDSDDTEWQHGLQASNRLSKRDIEAMLKALQRLDGQNNRHAQEGERRPVIATTGEILAHDEEEEFESELANRDTKGRTAIAWLEEATLVARGDNQVTIFPSSLRIRGISEARDIVDRALQRDRRYADQLIQIVRRVMNAAADTGISTDELTSVTGLEPSHLRKALRQRTGSVRAFPIAGTNRVELQSAIVENTKRGSTIYSDSHAGYSGLRGYQHFVVAHSVGEYVRGQAHTNGIESFWALLKRGYYGIYHQMSIQHLHRYVNEFSHRQNTVQVDTIDCMGITVDGMTGRRLPYRELTA